MNLMFHIGFVFYSVPTPEKKKAYYVLQLIF